MYEEGCNLLGPVVHHGDLVGGRVCGGEGGWGQGPATMQTVNK